MMEKISESIIHLLRTRIIEKTTEGMPYKRSTCYEYSNLLRISLRDCYKLLDEIASTYYRSEIIYQESEVTPDFTEGEIRVWIFTSEPTIEYQDIIEMGELAKEKAILNAAVFGKDLTGWVEKLRMQGYELNEKIDIDEVTDQLNKWKAILIIKDYEYDIL